MTTRRLLRWPLDVVVRPSAFARTDRDQGPANTVDALASAAWIVGFYFLNLLLYALPLTLAGFGIQEGSAAPAFAANALEPFGNPEAIWQFLTSLFLNGIFLLIATALTFATFHVGVVLAGSSRGVLRSLRAVVYSTGIYLTVMFSTVVYVSTAPDFAVAEELLLWIQTAFIQFFIDFVGADLVPPIEATRPTLAAITAIEQVVLTILLLASVYFLYVLYVAARTSHDASRLEATIATGFVLASPALYVLGTIFLNL